MKIYTVHAKDEQNEELEKALFVKEGFSFFAAIFQVIWALYHRMWLCAALLILVNISILLLFKNNVINQEVFLVLRIAIFAFVGFSANDWYRASLEKRGIKLMEVVSGSDELDAKRRLFSSYIRAV